MRWSVEQIIYVVFTFSESLFAQRTEYIVICSVAVASLAFEDRELWRKRKLSMFLPGGAFHQCCSQGGGAEGANTPPSGT